MKSNKKECRKWAVCNRATHVILDTFDTTEEVEAYLTAKGTWHPEMIGECPGVPNPGTSGKTTGWELCCIDGERVEVRERRTLYDDESDGFGGFYTQYMQSTVGQDLVAR